MNVKKSFLLIFSRRGKSCPTVTELNTSKGSISRPADRFIRFLGLLLDENLSFKRHIESMRLKVSRGLGIIRKLKRVFPFSILRLLYFSLIYPYLCYCSSVWMSTFPSVLTPLLNLQLKAAKVLQSTTHISVELLKIKDIHTLHLSFIAFQYFRGDLPSSFSGLLEIVRNVSPYETRNRDDVLVPSTPAVRSDFGLIVAVGRAWNSIPVGIRRSCTIGSFKKQLKNFFNLKKLN